ncbi:GNAT family N-acetyltransferase [Kitasatospora sp. CB01950]|uniref:GNAT family N-acetyltransferase n=1 Tax=Kitasatospora sp. CB01950 TaxID=1703930 RepID=UPI000939ECF9|nr:GNAT family N-acetyltransferase [Kitasatospora sp. CB01950]OKJ16112.1 acetyltransferase [Kitasatospora sp. CB01950]
MRLRDVGPGDVEAYLRMRCDPVMMAELGGPQPVEGIAEKVRLDAERTAADDWWVRMIVPDGAPPEAVAGTVTLWPHEEDGVPISEIGWMVLPEFQGLGLAKRAVREVLESADRDGRWGLVHAFPGTGNGASNGLCRALGFELLGERDTEFAGRVLRTNHWTVDPARINSAS